MIVIFLLFSEFNFLEYGPKNIILQPKLESLGYTVGTDIFLAFSPERVDPGNKLYTTKNTPKVVGGVTQQCTKLACAVYSHSIDSTVPVSSPRAAELVKLYENNNVWFLLQYGRKE